MKNSRKTRFRETSPNEILKTVTGATIGLDIFGFGGGRAGVHGPTIFSFFPVPILLLFLVTPMLRIESEKLNPESSRKVLDAPYHRPSI
jgi:hypothetical protein